MKGSAKLKRVIRKILPSRVLNFYIKIRISFKYLLQNFPHAIYWAASKTEFSNYYYDITDLNKKFIASNIATLFKLPIDEVMGYIQEIENDSLLTKSVLDFKEENQSYRDSKIFPGRRLAWYCIVRALKPSLVVETGVHNGLGGTIILLGLQKNGSGEYIGIDINPHSGEMIPSELRASSQLVIADSTNLHNFLRPNSVDLLITDSDHRYEFEMQELANAESILSENYVIISDNSHDSTALLDFSIQKNRNFLYIQEITKNHWYSGAGIGISTK